jgi:hypothetical protein
MGFVMMWGRFISYLSVFIMIYLYHLLAKKEEELCLARFGKAYEEYRRKRMGLLPGMDSLTRMTAGTLFSSRSKGVALTLGFLLTLGLALGSGFTIMKARQAFSAKGPLFQKKVTWHDRELWVVSPMIPYLNQNKGERHFKFWMKNVSPEDFLLAVQSSERIRNQLKPFYQEGMNTVLMIFEPRLSVREEEGNTFFSFYMVPMNAETDSALTGLNDFRKNAQPLGMLRIEKMLAISNTEPVQGDIEVVTTEDVEHDEAVKALIENKVDVLLSRFY